MARPLRIEFPGACYHVMNRGNDRRRIFDSDKDYELFFRKLGEFSNLYRVEVRSYCLMANHFHLYICTPEGNLSRYMQSLLTSYTVSKNRRDRRRRHLFQGRFKGLLVDDEGYGSVVSRYIHINPGMTRAAKSLGFEERVKLIRQYSWSSYASIVGFRRSEDWLSVAPVLCRWGEKARDQQRNYIAYVEEGLLNGADDPFQLAAARSILGREDFVEKCRRGLTGLSEKVNILREQVDAKRLLSWVEFDRLVKIVSDCYGVRPENLLSRYYRHGDSRGVLMHLSSKYCRGRYSLTKLSELHGISLGGYTSSCYKFNKHLSKNTELRKIVEEIENCLRIDKNIK